MITSSIAVFTSFQELEPKAQALAKTLGLSFTQAPDRHEYLLLVTPEHIGLKNMRDKTTPLVVDFAAKDLQYRCQRATLRNESIARALGLKKQTPLTLVDATAGLAQDSFIVAALGFEITLLERSPIVATLVQDALTRAGQDAVLAPIIHRMHLIQTDAIAWLKAAKPVDIVYLDPMFPERKKSALTRKSMRIFHDIVGDDTDSEELFQAAFACASKRVVVKRPRLASELAGLKPNFSLTGSSSRFDIYLT